MLWWWTIRKLWSSDEGVRSAAIDKLSQERKPRVVEALLRVLRDRHEGPIARAGAAEVLGNLKELRAFEPLQAALKDQDQPVRFSAAKALGKLGDKRALESLVEALADDNKYVRGQVVGALGQLADLRAIQPLRQRMQDRKEEREMGEKAARALAALARLYPAEVGAALTPPQAAEDALQVLLTAVTEANAGAFFAVLESAATADSTELRKRAIDLLACVPGARPLPLLVRALADKDQRVAGTASAAFRKAADGCRSTGNPDALDALVAELSHVDERTCAAVRSALERIDPAWRQATVVRSRLPRLLAELVHPDSNTRGAAGRALVQINPDWATSEEATQALPFFYEALRHEDFRVRTAAAIQLGSIGNSSAVGPLMAALQDAEWLVRLEAAKALGGLRDNRATPALIALLGDQGGDVRWAAVEALQKVDPNWTHSAAARAAMAPLVVAMADSESSEMDRLEGVLRAIDPEWRTCEETEQAISTLLSALGEKDSRKRSRVASFLPLLGSIRAVEPLIAATQDRSAKVRHSAILALGLLGDSRAIEPLTAALGDSAPKVRVAAADALRQLLPVEEASRLIGEAEAEKVEGGTSWKDVFKAEIHRFLTSARTKGYEQQTGAWWSREDLKLVVAKAYLADAGPEVLFPAAEEAIDELVREGRLVGTASGYRAAN